MPITESFSEKYSNLVYKGEGIPVKQLGSYPDCPQLPEGYGREWVHPDEGFVNLFCKDYDSIEKCDAQNE